MCFRRLMAGARIRCLTCKHQVTLSPAMVSAMFPQAVPIDTGKRRLKCSLCGAKNADIEAVWRPERGKASTREYWHDLPSAALPKSAQLIAPEA